MTPDEDGFFRIGSDDVRIAISPYGAALARVYVRGHACSLVLGLPRAEDYADAPHAIGVVVGPIAGRISGAAVCLNGKAYEMPANTPPDCLHSGPDGVQHRLWDVVEHAPSALTLACDLKDGACGLPGNRRITAAYSVTDAALTLELSTTTDADTFINVTNHAYWTLDDHGDLATHRMQVAAGHMVQTGADLIPTGVLQPIADTAFDFRAPRSPVDGPPLDGTFCLTGAPALHLHSVRSGLSLNVRTDQPGLVLYTGENMPKMDAPEGTPPIAPFSAIAVEAQGFPDAPNQPDFPPILLRAGATSRQKTVFELGQARA